MSKRITAADREKQGNEKRLLTSLINEAEVLIDEKSPLKKDVNELIKKLGEVNDELLTKPFIANKNKIIETLNKKLEVKETPKRPKSDPSKTSVFSNSRKGILESKEEQTSIDDKAITLEKKEAKKPVSKKEEVEVEIGTVVYTVKLEGRIVEAIRNRAHSQRVEMLTIFNDILRSAFSDNELEEGEKGFQLSQEVQRKRGVRKMKRKGD